MSISTHNLRARSNRGTWDDASIFGDGGRFNDRNVELVVCLVLSVEAIHEINREHGQMLVEELDVAIV